MLLAALAVVAFAAYHPVWHGGMLWDDDAHLTRPELRTLGGLWRIWFELGATQQYYPLVHSVFWAQSKLWGHAFLGYHFVNIGLHALSAALLAVVLWRLTIPGALVAAFVFALHPVHVESVAWMTELKNTLSGVLYLGSALVYLRFDERRSRGSYFAALGLFVLALFSKSVTATLPAALLVLFWWRRGTLNWRIDVIPLMPFFALGAAAGMTTSWVERTFIGAQGSDFGLTAIERVLVAGRAIAFYLVTLAWPSNLMFMYPRWDVSQAVWWQYLYPVGIIGLIGAAWALRGRTRAPLAAVLFFCVTLFPALGFVNVYPFRYSFVADHFQYLGSIGIITLAAAALVSAVQRMNRMRLDAAQALVIMTICTPLALVTSRQSRQYVSAETLYVETLHRNPRCWLAHENLGILGLHGQLVGQNGKTSAKDRDAAVAHFRTALEIEPDEPQVHNNLGTTLMEMGRLDDALAEHRLAVQYAPGYAEARGNVGADLQKLGRLAEAAAAYREALDIKPSLSYARANLSVVLQQLNLPEEADAQLREASTRQAAQTGDPASAEASVNVAAAYAAAGKFPEAAAEYQSALRRGTDSPQIRAGLGFALWRLGRLDEAADQLRQAIRLEPSDPATHAMLGNVLQAMQRVADAVPEYQEAIRLQPGATAAAIHNDLGVALARLGRRDEAVTHFTEAVRIKPDFPAAAANLAKARAMSR